MKVFVSTDHDGHWPVGVASVVVAADETEARRLLDAELRRDGLKPDEPYTLREVDTGVARAEILCDGNY